MRNQRPIKYLELPPGGNPATARLGDRERLVVAYHVGVQFVCPRHHRVQRLAAADTRKTTSSSSAEVWSSICRVADHSRPVSPRPVWTLYVGAPCTTR